MYNGLGLRTPRGSGTNGFVQRNLSFARPKISNNFQYDQLPSKSSRKPSLDILLHQSKRQIEVECLQYEEELLESGKYSSQQVRDEVETFRGKQLAKLDHDTLSRDSSRMLKEQKDIEMDRVKDAFGIKNDAIEGQAFKFESEKQRQERLARYAEEDRLERKKRLRDR